MKISKYIYWAIIIVAIVLVLYLIVYLINSLQYTRNINIPDDLRAGYVATTTINIATTTPNVFGQTDPSLLDPNNSTIDTSDWQSYGDSEIGYSLKYPDYLLINNDDPNQLVMVFPKDQFFHWPLLDDVKVSIIASTTCPSLQAVGPLSPLPSKGVINDNDYTRAESADVAAGNIYRELAYDIVKDDICFHIDLFSHGSNGAGLYVSDSNLVKKYNDQHTADMKAMLQTFNAIVSTFQVLLTPPGIPEDQVSPLN